MIARSLVVIVLGLLALGVLIPNHPSGRVPDEDAGIFLYVAQQLVDGGLPYRDAWDHKTPLIYFVDALGLLLTPGGLDGVWALEVLALWSAATLLYAALRSLGRAAALFAAVTFVISVPRFVLAGGLFTNFTELFGLPLQTAAFYLLARDRGTSEPAWKTAGLGIVGGATLALKPPLIGVWLVVAVYLGLRARAAGSRRFVAWLATLAGGAILVPLALLAVFASRGAFTDLWDQAIMYNRAYVSSSSLEERVGAIVEGARYAIYARLPFIAAAGGAVALVHMVWASGRGVQPIVRVAIASLPIVVVLAGASGNAYGIYALPWLPSLAVIGGYAASSVVDGLRNRMRSDKARAVFAPAMLAVVLGVMAIRPAELIQRGAMTGDDGRVRTIAAYLREHTGPDDRVLVWGSRTEILVLAERRSATRFVYQYAPLYTVGYQRPELTRELVDDLRQRPPVVIVDATPGSPLSIPLSIERVAAWDSYDASYAAPPEIERVLEIVRSSYQVTGTTDDGWTLYRRADQR